EQAEKARPLDRLGEFALLLAVNRCDAARDDLAALGHEALQQPDVLIVDGGRVGARERAGLAATEERTARTAATTAGALRGRVHGTGPSFAGSPLWSRGRSLRSLRSPRSRSPRSPRRRSSRDDRACIIADGPSSIVSIRMVM